MTLGMTIAVILHVIGSVIGVGAVTVNDFMLLRAVGDGDLGVAYQKSASAYSMLVWLGWLLLAGSALYMGLTNSWVMHSPKMLLKLFLFLILTVNGLLMGGVLIPLLHRLKREDWEQKTDALKRVVMLGVLPGAISIATWYSILVLGAAGRQETWTLEYMSAVVLAFFVAAWIGAYGVARWRLATK